MAETAVIVPFRGQWSSVVPTLKALASQTIRENLTIVLSMDGPLNPPAEIAGMADVCVNGKQMGPAAARNRGWKSTDAPLILFTDSDCIPDPDWAQRMTEKLYGEYQAVKGVYSSGGRKLIQRLAQVEFEERYRLMQRAPVIYLADTYSAGFKRDWLEKLGGFDEKFYLPEHEDVDFSWRLTGSGGRIGFVSDAMVKHIHRSTWAAYFRMKYRRGKWRIMLVRRFPERAVKDGYTPQTLKLQMLLSIPAVLSVFLLPVYPMIPISLIIIYLLLCVPLVLTSLRTDPAIVFFIPFFALWRGIALFSGVVRGTAGRSVQCLHQ
jgi:GT2 family glycosyltransferase